MWNPGALGWGQAVSVTFWSPPLVGGDPEPGVYLDGETPGTSVEQTVPHPGETAESAEFSI